MMGGDTERGHTLTCKVCPHGCRLGDGQVGRCRARWSNDGMILPLSHGKITSFALDPVEKKPLARWNPGKYLLSVGTFGCNLSCPFCQNHAISQADQASAIYQFTPAGALVSLALEARKQEPRVVGIAHTYNEPLVSWEYIVETSMLARRVGLANVIVSNGCVNGWVVDRIAPVVDAANIDLKGFTEDYYRWCGGDLAAVRACIERLAAEPGCHLEVTTLVVAGHNDTPAEMDALSAWLAAVDPDITLHVTRCFPRWKMSGERPTPVQTVLDLADVARANLAHVFVGNV